MARIQFFVGKEDLIGSGTKSAKCVLDGDDNDKFWHVRCRNYEFVEGASLPTWLARGAQVDIVRHVTDDRFPHLSLELSYPALKGASGSPVVVLEGRDAFKVVGITIANIQYELMPVQTYIYRDTEDGTEEETRYCLPAGLAVNASHLSALLSSDD